MTGKETEYAPPVVTKTRIEEERRVVRRAVKAGLCYVCGSKAAVTLENPLCDACTLPGLGQ